MEKFMQPDLVKDIPIVSSKDKEKYEAKLFFEKQAIKQNYKLIAGIDEAGRGPLAGPVVAACCILDLDKTPIYGLDDSKKLSLLKREFLFEKIQLTSIHFSVAVVSHDIVDKINILQATIQAMKQAVTDLSVKPDCLLVDGMSLDWPETEVVKIIKGDSLSNSIAAASILAKVTRDHIMLEYDKVYPQYGFAQHKGYGTKAHYAALDAFGPCPIHRQSFLRKYFAQKTNHNTIFVGK